MCNADICLLEQSFAALVALNCLLAAAAQGLASPLQADNVQFPAQGQPNSQHMADMRNWLLHMQTSSRSIDV